MTIVIKTDYVDRDGDLITHEAMAKAIPMFMKFPIVSKNFESGKAIGKVVSILDVKDKDFVATIELTDEGMEWINTKIRDNGLRPGFMVINESVVEENGKKIRIYNEIDLIELSLVDERKCQKSE